jgi:hypothetical protein
VKYIYSMQSMQVTLVGHALIPVLWGSSETCSCRSRVMRDLLKYIFPSAYRLLPRAILPVQTGLEDQSHYEQKHTDENSHQSNQF